MGNDYEEDDEEREVYCEECGEWVEEMCEATDDCESYQQVNGYW